MVLAAAFVLHDMAFRTAFPLPVFDQPLDAENFGQSDRGRQHPLSSPHLKS
jgi:hypothetical protein